MAGREDKHTIKQRNNTTNWKS